MIDLILATDMTSHSALMAKWTAILDAGLDYGNEEHLRMVRTRTTLIASGLISAVHPHMLE